MKLVMSTLINRIKMAIYALIGGAKSVNDYLAKSVRRDISNEAEKHLVASSIIADVIRAVMVHIYGYPNDRAVQLASQYAITVTSMIMQNYDLTKTETKSVYHT